MGTHPTFSQSGPSQTYGPEVLDTTDMTTNPSGVVMSLRVRSFQPLPASTVIVPAVAASANAALANIPAAGPFKVRVKLAYDAAPTFVAFGTSNSAAATAPGAGAAGDFPLEPGEVAEFMVPPGTTYIAAISPNAASSPNATASNLYATTGY